MGTFSVTASGFAALPAGAPANWPAGVVWPGGGNPNGSRSVTISDADWVKLLTWAAATYVAQNAGPNNTPTVITAPQVLVTLPNSWFQGLKDAVQRYFTGTPSIPPPIVMT